LAGTQRPEKRLYLRHSVRHDVCMPQKGQLATGIW